MIYKIENYAPPPPRRRYTREIVDFYSINGDTQKREKLCYRNQGHQQIIAPHTLDAPHSFMHILGAMAKKKKWK